MKVDPISLCVPSHCACAEAAEPDPLAKYVIPEEERFLELQAKTRLILRREKKEFSERKVDGLRAAETEVRLHENGMPTTGGYGEKRGG